VAVVTDSPITARLTFPSAVPPHAPKSGGGAGRVGAGVAVLLIVGAAVLTGVRVGVSVGVAVGAGVGNSVGASVGASVAIDWLGATSVRVGASVVAADGEADELSEETEPLVTHADAIRQTANRPAILRKWESLVLEPWWAGRL
jgi:hypothetical protein